MAYENQRTIAGSRVFAAVGVAGKLTVLGSMCIAWKLKNEWWEIMKLFGYEFLASDPRPPRIVRIKVRQLGFEKFVYVQRGKPCVANRK